MDQYNLSKLGNVTIEKISPSNADGSRNANISNLTKEIPQNTNIPPGIQLPKLPPSINIFVKSNSNTIDNAVSETTVNDENVLIQNETKNENFNYCPVQSSGNQENEYDAKDVDSDEASSASENHDNLIESTNNVDNETSAPIDSQEHSDSSGDETEEMEYAPVTSNVDEVDEKMDSNDSERDKALVDKEYEDEAELPEVKEEYTGNEYADAEGVVCGEDLPEVPVNELIEGELPESVICKEEYSDNETETESDEADDELDDSQNEKDGRASSKRKKKKRSKSEEESEETSNGTKKQKTSSEKTEGEDKEKTTSELKVGNLRRNIREVMDETKLDEATLSAQMQEKERLRRVQEQLRATRDMQRQQMQARVLSLIETGGASISSKEPEELSDVEDQKPNTVVVKLSSSSGAPQLVNRKMLDLLKKHNASSDSDDEVVPLDKFANLSKNLSKPQMMTSSVSIAPVKNESKIKEEADLDEEEDVVEPIEALDDDEDNDDEDDDDLQPKNKDVVMISSSSDEDDDCIVISEDEESEPEEDTSNSGMHTNDDYNIPDDQGRVLINVGHPENEKDVFLAPQISRIIKPHQIGGVRFLFDNIVESLDRFKTSDGFGCILAHSMGLGKTLQVVSFCDVFLRYTEGRSILCIMPINTLQNWVAEFNMWLPKVPEGSPSAEQGDVLGRQFPLFVLNDNQKTLSARAIVIQKWFKEGGVLLIGYELYRQLCLKKSPKSRHRSKKKVEVEEDNDDEKSKSLLEIMYNALVKPGPDLVICDEGHRIKNSHASISQALKQIRSKRRVVLTGYPLQNNLLEYWCMVDFVRPNYLGTKTEFSNMFERPIQNGQCIDSTPQDVKLMRYRAHVLHSLLEGFVQRRSHQVLQRTLPNKEEFVLLLRMTPFQKKLYNTFMNDVVRTKAVPNPLKAFAVCCKIWNHPDILYHFLKKRAGEEDIDLDLEETVPNIGTPSTGPSTPMTPSTPPHQLASKRGRTRGKTKDKPPRKNARTNLSQPIIKSPAIATVPPNTASNPEPLNQENVTNTENPSVSSFDSFNNNQFQNFNQSSNDNSNFIQSGGTSSSQNFNNNQYSQPEYSANQAASTSNEYSSVGYQQNYNEGGNYYQSEYNQPNNYWASGGNDEGNFYNNSNSNNSAPSNVDNYYQSSSSSSSSSQTASQSYSGDYSSQGESSQSPYGNQNFNYDVNQSMQPYSNEFPSTKQLDMGAMPNYSMNNNTTGMESNLMTDINSSTTYPNEMPPNDMNFGLPLQASSNTAPMNLQHFGGQNVPQVGADGLSFNAAANRDVYPGSGKADLSVAESSTFNSFTPPATPKRQRGRPPSLNQRGAGARQRRNANPLSPNNSPGGQSSTFVPLLFKPGLPGGAPLKTGTSQSYSIVPDPTNAQPTARMLPNNDMNQSYPPSQMNMHELGNDGMWNQPTVTSQNPVYPDPNYSLYNEMPAQNSNFMPNEAPQMMGVRGGGSDDARGSRNILTDIQHNEIFNPPEESGYPSGNADSIFNLDQFNYINDLPMPAHTSFMGLLEGVDSMEMGRGGSSGGGGGLVGNSNVVSASTAPHAPEIASQCGGGGGAVNYMETGMQYQSTNKGMATSASSTSTSVVSAAPTNKSVVGYAEMGGLREQSAVGQAPARPPSKAVNDSLLGLARTGQITLKKVDMKSEHHVAPPLAKSAPSATVTKPEFVQNRLPSMDVFSGNAAGQNYAAGGSAVQESGNFDSQSAGPYGFNKNQSSNSASASLSSSTTSLSTQTSWDSYANYSNEYSGPGGGEKSQNLGNFNASAAPGNTTLPPDAQRNASKAMQFERAPTQMTSQGDNFDGPSLANAASKDRLAPQHDANKMSNPLPKKPNEDGPNRNYYQSAKADDLEQNTQTQFGMNVCAAAGSSSGKVDKKLMPPKRSSPITSPTEMYQETTMKDNLKNDIDGSDCKVQPEVTTVQKNGKEEPGIPYDWATDFVKDYNPGIIEASAKTFVFFCMLDEIIKLGDRLLLFSQSLFTLDLLEDFLSLRNIPNTEEKWARNKSYFRLDGSTTALEREKLINEFNQNPSIHLFLVSTRAGSLGINLVGANRVVVFDASWNPCHDTQAVCRVYRYGQQKPCYVYRFVMDNCLEKKIYDRQINKQGMSDRIVDECNPDAHLTIKDVSNLCWDDIELNENNKDLSEFINKYDDVVIKKVIRECGSVLSKEPFQHESLLVDRADKKLSQAEKRMAKRGYELEKQASLKPSYGLYTPLSMQNRMGKPTASVRPYQPDQNHQRENVRRFIPAEVWQKQGTEAQEMTLPIDIVIPTSTTDNPSSIRLNAGEKVMVLKSHKGIYMQLENGKIIAIKTDVGSVTGKPVDCMPGIPANSQISPKMPLRPPRPPLNRSLVDRSLAALSHRSDVTVSPIRHRFPVRPPNMPPIPNLPPRASGLNRSMIRPHPPQVPRPFNASRLPLVRPTSRLQSPVPSQIPQPAAAKQMFGPNSAVTISVANRRRMESQIRGTLSREQHMGRSFAGRVSRNYERESTANLTEVAYDDYEIGPLREPIPPSRPMNEARKASTPMNEYSNTSGGGRVDGGYGSRPPYGHPQPSPRDTRNPTPSLTNPLRNTVNRSDVIPESLRYKKDINLTPVAKNPLPKTSALDRALPAMSETASRSKLPHNVPYQHHQQQQQQQQHHHQPPQHRQHPQPYHQMASQANKMGSSTPPKAPHTGLNLVRNRPQQQQPPPPPQPQNLSGVGADAATKAKKDTITGAIGKNIELPKSAALSIFPVNKKGGDDGAGSMAQSVAPLQAEQQPPSSASYQQQAKNDYYAPPANYASNKQQQPPPSQYGNYPDAGEGQFSSHQYDAYKQNYPTGGFAPSQPEYQQQQSEQPQQQQQQSFNSSQYSSSSYPAGDNFAASGRSYAGGENSTQQYSNTPSMYQSQSSSQDGYDQYGSFYNYGQKGGDSSQAPARAGQSS